MGKFNKYSKFVLVLLQFLHITNFSAADQVANTHPLYFVHSLSEMVSHCPIILLGKGCTVFELEKLHGYSTLPLLLLNEQSLKPLTHTSSLATRFTRKCFISVGALESQDDVDNFVDSVKRVNHKIRVQLIKTAVDYFVFSFLDSYAKLNLRSLGLKIRHKLFIFPQTEFSLLRLCVFCGENSMTPTPVIYRQTGADLVELLPNYIRNLNGHQIRASVPAAVVARVGLIKLENGEYRTERGLQLVLLNMLRDELNFTYKVFPSTGGGGTGLQTANGSWEGVVGDIYHDRADLGFGVGISLQRSKLIDFVGYYEYISLAFTHGPQQRIFTWRAIFWPFSPEAWIFLLFCSAFTFAGFVVSVLDARRKIRLLRVYGIHEGTDALKTSWSELLLFFYASLLTQEGRIPRVNSARTLSIFWLFVALVVSTAYTSKLFSFLAFPVYEKAPQTFEELGDSDFGVGLRYIGGYGYNMFKTSTSPHLHKIFKRMDLHKDPLKCFSKTLTSRYACISYELQFQYSSMRNFSDKYGRTPLIFAPGRVFPVSVGLGVQKDSVFGAQVDKKVSFAFETGLVREWSDKDMRSIHQAKLVWAREANVSLPEIADASRPLPISVPQLTGSFTVLILGLIVSTVAWVGEFFWRRFYCRSKPLSEQVDLVSMRVPSLALLASFAFSKTNEDGQNQKYER